jgi:hypothetical protein
MVGDMCRVAGYQLHSTEMRCRECSQWCSSRILAFRLCGGALLRGRVSVRTVHLRTTVDSENRPS